MKYNFSLDEFPNAHFQLEMPIAGRPALLMNGITVPASMERKGLARKYFFEVPSGNDQVVKAQLTIVFPTFTPALIIDKTKHSVIRKLVWYEYIIGCLPLVLLAGGALGGAFGAIATMVNFKIIASENGNKAVNYLKAIGISVLAGIAYFLLAGSLYAILKN